MNDEMSIATTDLECGTPATPVGSDKRQKREISEVDPDSPQMIQSSDQRILELLKTALIPVHASLNEIKAQQLTKQKETTLLTKKIEELSEQNEDMKSKMNHLEKENLFLKKKTLSLELHSRRSNLRFHGLTENEGENPQEVVEEFLKSKAIFLPDDAFERVHRLGRKQDKRIRPIIARFSHFRDREAIWDKLGHKFFPPAFDTKHIREDFPEEIDRNRMKLFTIASAALNVKLPDTQKKTKVNMVIDTLYINSERYTVDTLNRLPDNLKPAVIYTPMTDDKVAFFTGNSPLSNHFLADFTHEGQTYNCMEQFIMCEKAKACDDQESLVAIKKEEDPVQQKRLGRYLRNFDNKQWESIAQEKILPGLQAKFQQNLVCRTMLENTGTRRIYEANPHDAFWGIGLSLFSKEIWNESSHNGRNMLGKSLEIVREKIND